MVNKQPYVALLCDTVIHVHSFFFEADIHEVLRIFQE